jgi:hypothetical protein
LKDADSEDHNHSARAPLVFPEIIMVKSRYKRNLPVNLFLRYQLSFNSIFDGRNFRNFFKFRPAKFKIKILTEITSKIVAYFTISGFVSSPESWLPNQSISTNSSS